MQTYFPSIKHGKNYSADTGEEGKKGKINFRPGIEPGPRDSKGSDSTRFGESASVRLADSPTITGSTSERMGR